MHTLPAPRIDSSLKLAAFLEGPTSAAWATHWGESGSVAVDGRFDVEHCLGAVRTRAARQCELSSQCGRYTVSRLLVQGSNCSHTALPLWPNCRCHRLDAPSASSHGQYCATIM
jgi:hypothetical protein